MLILFFTIGACIGSFINVVTYRLPLMMQREIDHSGESSLPIFNLMTPRSHCPACGKTLGVLQLIPLLSWLIQRGRCHHCHRAISPRYPLTELAVGSIFTISLFCWHDPLTALAVGVLGSALLTLATIDAKHLLLPDAITLPLMWCGLLWNTTGKGLVPLEDAVLGAAVGYLSLWSIYWLYRLLRNKEALGYGDFKLMAALGAWLGVGSINAMLLLGSLIGCAGWILCRRQRQDTVMPFGPALIAAASFWLLCHSPILADGVLASVLNGFLG
ncbi:prepilin peptidase (plasmid) [Enterobacteriaceae bacterium Kacie_13]|nr:prepilin peptidase [Enterobacteriaceae bacterium Kacie_13]